VIDLSSHKCVPCEGGTQPLTKAEFSVYLPQVSDWTVVNDLSLTKKFEFKNFSSALGFITRIGLLAEKEGHHPDINLHDYKFVDVTTTTHAIGGLSVNDFVMAVKIDQLL